MEALVLQLSGSSHTSSLPSGSKPCHGIHIPLLSTPAAGRGLSPTNTGPSTAASVAQHTSGHNEQSVSSTSDLSSVLKGK